MSLIASLELEDINKLKSFKSQGVRDHCNIKRVNVLSRWVDITLPVLTCITAVPVSEEFSSSGDSKTEEEERRPPKEKEGKEKDRDSNDGNPVP